LRSRKSRHEVRAENEEDLEKSSCPPKESSTSTSHQVKEAEVDQNDVTSVEPNHQKERDDRSSETGNESEPGSEPASDEADAAGDGSDADFNPEAASEDESGSEEEGKNTRTKRSPSVSTSDSEDLPKKGRPSSSPKSKRKNLRPVRKC
jgi:hypothetical protein